MAGRALSVGAGIQAFKEEVDWSLIAKMINFTGPGKFKSEDCTNSKVKKSTRTVSSSAQKLTQSPQLQTCRQLIKRKKGCDREDIKKILQEQIRKECWLTDHF